MHPPPPPHTHTHTHKNSHSVCVCVCVCDSVNISLPNSRDTPWDAMPPGISKSLQVAPLSQFDDEQSSDEESQYASDLRMVCELPPVLETRASAQVVKAVGSAIHRSEGQLSFCSVDRLHVALLLRI